MTIMLQIEDSAIDRVLRFFKSLENDGVKIKTIDAQKSTSNLSQKIAPFVGKLEWDGNLDEMRTNRDFR
jgi:hypothetical protein